MQLSLQNQLFSGEDLILMLDLLAQFVAEAYILGMSKGQAYISLPYFLWGLMKDQYHSVRGSSLDYVGGINGWPQRFSTSLGHLQPSLRFNRTYVPCETLANILVSRKPIFWCDLTRLSTNVLIYIPLRSIFREWFVLNDEAVPFGDIIYLIRTMKGMDFALATCVEDMFRFHSCGPPLRFVPGVLCGAHPLHHYVASQPLIIPFTGWWSVVNTEWDARTAVYLSHEVYDQYCPLLHLTDTWSSYPVPELLNDAWSHWKRFRADVSTRFYRPYTLECGASGLVGLQRWVRHERGITTEKECPCVWFHLLRSVDTSDEYSMRGIHTARSRENYGGGKPN